MSEPSIETEPHVLQPPRVCGDETEKMEWAGACTVSLDDGARFGVRCSSPALLAVVERALASRLVTAEDIPAYYSLKLGAPNRRTQHPLHYLYHGGRAVLATRDVGRLLGALMRLIGALNENPDNRIGLRLYTTALTTPDGRTFLVPSDLRLVPKEVEKSLTAKGYRLADVSQVELDPEGPDLVLQRPDLGIDWSAIEPDQLTEVAATKAEPILDFGRHRLAGWLLSVPEDQAGPLRPALAIAHSARLVDPPFRGGAATVLDELGSVVRTVPVTGLPYTAADQHIDQILAAL